MELTTTTIQRLRHVLSLAWKARVWIIFWNGENNHYHPFFRMVDIPFPNTDIRYAVCLHELGHATLRHRYNHEMTDIFVVSCEKEAWEWAAKTALYWTPEMDLNTAKSLSSYVDFRLGDFSLAAKLYNGVTSWRDL